MANPSNRNVGSSIKFQIHISAWILFLFLFGVVMIVPTLIVRVDLTNYNSAFNSTGPHQPARPTKPQQGSGPQKPNLTIGWVSGNKGPAMQHLADYKNLSIVSPGLATIDNQYNLQVNSDSSVINNIQQQGKKVWARVVIQDDSSPNIHTFLTSQTKIAEVIQKIYDAAVANQWYGVNLDIENVAPSDRDIFSQFVKGLSDKLNNSIKLSIDLPPDPNGGNEKSPFDHKLLGKYCNYIIFMGYDQHWSTDPVPGPVTSLPWLKENLLDFIQSGVPAEKLILGLPAYTRIWEVNQQNQIVNDPAEPIHYVENLMGQNHINITWNPNLGEYYTSYKVNNLQYEIWLPTIKSFNLYLNLISQFHLGGSAVWNLDQIDPDYWNKIYK